ncbi:MAG: hypothetical protein N3B21_18900 [Clostridia bacterium]|nr:hypothetical protein [Clostridia bacterium]
MRSDIEELAQKVEKVNELLHEANAELYRFWLSDMLFKWHWWINVALTVVPWIVWIIIRKKESTHRLLYAGSVMALISTLLDTLGMSLGLWGYNSKLIPIIPPFVPWDLCLIPVSTMILLQYFPRINPWIKAIVYALAGSFIVQPLAEWIGLYNPKVWKHYYSFPFVIVLYMLANYLFTRKEFMEIKS